MLIVERTNSGHDLFHLTVPESVRLFESSWSFYEFDNHAGDWFNFKLDDELVAEYSDNVFFYEAFSSQIKIGFRHKFEIIQGCSGNCSTSSLGVVLIYTS